MKKLLFAPLLLAGCFDFDHHVHQRDLAWRGLTDDDLNGPPTEVEVRARIINDIRKNRMLIGRLDEGMPDCGDIVFDKGAAVCARDQEPMSVLPIRSDSPDRLTPVTETAFYCPKERVYYYRYQGGTDSRVVWMGPFPTRLKPGNKE